MKPFPAALAFVSVCLAQAPPTLNRDALTLLTFEGEHTGSMPAGWTGSGAAIDGPIVRSGSGVDAMRPVEESMTPDSRFCRMLL